MESISTLEIWQVFFTRLWPVWLALAITFAAAYQWRVRLGVIGRIFDSPIGLVGLFIVLFWVFSAIFADFIVLFDSLEQSGMYRRKPPGTLNTAQGIPYIFGTDTLGRDLFSRMIYGSQIVLLIAPAASLVAYVVGITLGLLVSAGLLRFGPSFENIAWSTMFLLAPFGCIYYPVEILPGIFQSIAFALPLVYIFEETRNILVNGQVNYENIYNALYLNIFYLILAISIFYYSFDKARDKGTLINIGE